MIEQPPYSFVRINEDGATINPCVNYTAECLPVKSWDDLRFQLITDFPNITGESILNQLIAIPCQDGCPEDAEDIFNDIWGSFTYAINFTTLTSDGYIKIGNTTTGISNINIGDTVYYFNGTEQPQGFAEVLNKEVQGSGHVLTLSIQPEVYGLYLYASVTKIPTSFNALIYNYSFQVADDVEFEGNNYVFNFGSSLGEIPYMDNQCFSLCIYRLTSLINTGDPASAPEFIDGECLGLTNCFTKISDVCYTTKITYGCDDDALGFFADTDMPFVNTIRLPLWLFAPKFPGDESGYQLSTGQFQKLSERINKTWEVETDYMPEQYHERLRVALSCDTITVTNENAQLTDVAIYRNAEYTIEWNEDVKEYPFAKARTTVFKKLLSRSINSNCV